MGHDAKPYLEIACFRSSLKRRSGTPRSCRSSALSRACAISARSGPSGDCQMRLNPVDKRTAALSKMKLPSSLTACTARAPGSHREPASTKNAPCIPMLSGTNGKGKRTSAVVAQKSSPPRESCEQFRYALSGIRIFAGIAWTVAGALEPTDRLTALEEEIGQADILSAPPCDRASLSTTDQGDLVGDRIITASVYDGPEVIHVAANTSQVLRE